MRHGASYQVNPLVMNTPIVQTREKIRLNTFLLYSETLKKTREKNKTDLSHSKVATLFLR